MPPHNGRRKAFRPGFGSPGNDYSMWTWKTFMEGFQDKPKTGKVPETRRAADRNPAVSETAAIITPCSPVRGYPSTQRQRGTGRKPRLQLPAFIFGMV